MYNKPMKNLAKTLGKIAVLDLPDSVFEALSAHAPLVRAEAAETADILLCGDGGACQIPAHLPRAIPRVILFRNRPERLSTVLRRLEQAAAEPALHIDDFEIGGHTFSPQERLLTTKDDEEISLTDRETDMLLYLARHPARAVTRDELLKNVWGYQDGVDTHTLETHIYRLRQKLGSRDALLITTEEGYRLCQS